MTCPVEPDPVGRNHDKEVQLQIVEFRGAALAGESGVAYQLRLLALQPRLLKQFAQAGIARILATLNLPGRYAPDVWQERLPTASPEQQEAPVVHRRRAGEQVELPVDLAAHAGPPAPSMAS